MTYSGNPVEREPDGQAESPVRGLSRPDRPRRQEGRGRHGAPSPRAVRRARRSPLRGWLAMIGLAMTLIVAAGAIGAITIITATPDPADAGPPAVTAPRDAAANAEGCRAFDRTLRRLDEILRSDAIPHPEIKSVLREAKNGTAAASQKTVGQTQQAVYGVIALLQRWSDHENAHESGTGLDDSTQVSAVRTAVAVVVDRCADAGVDLKNRLVG